MVRPELTREYDSDTPSKKNPLYCIWMGTFRRGDVCDEWYLYSNFEKWVFSQDYEGKELSKIIVEPHNNLYSPELCCYADRKTISQFTMLEGRNVCTIGNNYSVKHRGVYIGIYKTREEAESVYLDTRIKGLRELQTDDPQIHRGIENHINYLKDNR